MQKVQLRYVTSRSCDRFIFVLGTGNFSDVLLSGAMCVCSRYNRQGSWFVGGKPVLGLGPSSSCVLG